MRSNQVGLDGWCEGGFGQQWNDGGGCAILTDMEEWRALVNNMQLNEFHADIFAWHVFFRADLPWFGGYYLER